jgi:hypothetical protein
LTLPPQSESNVRQDDPVLKALNEMTARAIAAEAKNELYEGRLKDKDQIIEAWRGRAELDEKQLALSLENRADAAKIFTGDARLLEQANQVIAEQKAEIAKLRNPGLFASIFDRRTAYGGMVGYAACKLTSGSNPTITIPGLNSQFVMSSEDRARQALRLQK